MAVVVIKQPKTDVYTKISKWNAVHQPITFEFQRQDVKVIKALPSIYIVTPSTTIYFANASLPSVVANGQFITYIVNGVAYNHTVLKKTSNTIVINRISNAQINGGFLILKGAYTSYYLEVQIHGVNASNTFELLGSTKVTANDKGGIKVNIQEWLQTKAIFKNSFAYNRLNQLQIGEGSQFNITWREIFNGDNAKKTYSTLSDVNVFYWTNGTKQVQESYSQNMAEYVPTIDGTRTNKAKFQSVFSKPTYFVGYPFSLNFIYSEQLTNIDIKRREITKNINGIQVASTTDLLDMGGRGFGNRLMLKQGYTSNVKTIDVWLEAFTQTIYNPVSWTDDYSAEVFASFGEWNSVNLPFYYTNQQAANLNA